MFNSQIPFGYPETARLSRMAIAQWNVNFNASSNQMIHADHETLFNVRDWYVFTDGSVEFKLSMVSRREVMTFESDQVIGVECLGYHKWTPIFELKKVLNADEILPAPASGDLLTLTPDGVDWWNYRKEYLHNGFGEIDKNTKLNVIASQMFNAGEFEVLMCHMCTNTGEAYDVPEYFIQR